MTDSVLIFPPGWRVTDADGAVISGAKLKFDSAGTTTPLTVYSDSTLSTALGTTVYTDAGGYPVNASGGSTKVLVYTGTAAYKLTCTTSDDVTVWEHDNIRGALDTSSFLTTALTTISINVSAKSSAYTVVSGDKGTLFNCNPSGGAFTVTLPNAVTVGNGFWFELRHDGPTSANQVAWQTVASQTAKIYGSGSVTSGALERSGQWTRFVSDGSGWTAVDITPVPSRDYALSATVAASALTISLLNEDGSTPSYSTPVELRFRSATASSGTTSSLLVTGATQLVVSSGSTLAATANEPFNVWVALFNDAGTPRLAAIQCRSGSNIYPLAAEEIASSTAEGGAGGADSAQFFYTGSTVSSKPYILLGRLEFTSGLATPGTWNVAPTRIVRYREGLALPNARVQTVSAATTAVATGTTQLPFDDTIPQNTEGDQYQSISITPRSAGNVLEVDSVTVMACGSATGISAAMFKDSTADAISATTAHVQAGEMIPIRLTARPLATTASSTTFAVRAGPNGAFTVTFNGSAGNRRFGGVINSFMTVTEVQT